MRLITMMAAGALAIAPVTVFGQAPQQPMPPNIVALQQTVLKLTGEALDWQIQVITLQREVDGLKKQLAESEAKAPPVRKPGG